MKDDITKFGAWDGNYITCGYELIDICHRCNGTGLVNKKTLDFDELRDEPEEYDDEYVYCPVCGGDRYIAKWF